MPEDTRQMPLIEIHALPQPQSVDLANVCRTLNAAVAEAIGCKLEAVWTTWRTIDGAYVRGDQVRIGHTAAGFGPIVHVYHHRTRREVELVVEAIEIVLARELSIAPEDVFVTTQPVAIADATLP